MNRRRDLILANAAGLLVVLVVFLIGWRQEALFGLAVLVVLNLIVFFRGRRPPYDGEVEGQGSQEKEDDG